MSDLKDTTITFRISQDTKKKMQEIADLKKQNLSTYMIEICEYFLNQPNCSSNSLDDLALEYKIQTLLNRHKCHHLSSDKVIKLIEKELHHGND